MDIREACYTASPFKIEKNIPIPKRREEMAERLLLTKMEVGDSILVPYEEVTSNAAIRSYVSGWGRRNKKKFRTMKFNEGLRIWRTR